MKGGQTKQFRSQIPNFQVYKSSSKNQENNINNIHKSAKGNARAMPFCPMALRNGGKKAAKQGNKKKNLSNSQLRMTVREIPLL